MEGQPIATAPRDGTVVLVWDEEQPPVRMFWDAAAFNPLVSLREGIWVFEGGGLTWCEDHGFGPTHWAAIQ